MAELNDIVREICFGIFGGDYRSYLENEGVDLVSKLLSAKTVLKWYVLLIILQVTETKR